MANIKMPAHTKYDHIITRIHNEWCRENGYPERKPSSRVHMAGRPRANKQEATGGWARRPQA